MQVASKVIIGGNFIALNAQNEKEENLKLELFINELCIQSQIETLKNKLCNEWSNKNKSKDDWHRNKLNGSLGILNKAKS